MGSMSFWSRVEFSLKNSQTQTLIRIIFSESNGALPQNQGKIEVKIHYFNMASSERHWTHCVLVGTGFPWWCSVCFGEINSPLILVILPCNLLPSSTMYKYCIELEGSLGFKLLRQQIKQEDRNGPRHSMVQIFCLTFLRNSISESSEAL